MLQVLEQLVAENPNRTNPMGGTVSRGSGCVYREPDRTPSCIAGNVFARLGVLDRVVPMVYNPDVDDEWPDDGVNETRVYNLFDRGLLPDFTPEAVQMLDDVQRVADEGKPWGEALESVRS